MTEHIVATFETASAAEEAEHELEASGIEATAVRRYAVADDRADVAREAPAVEPHHRGFWAWLTGEEPQDETRQEAELYDRRVAAGNTVLSVTVRDDSKVHQVVEILDAHRPLDIDERTEEEPPMSLAEARRGEGAAVVRGGERVADRVEDVTPTREPVATAGMPAAQATGTPATPGIAPADARASAMPVQPGTRQTSAGTRETRTNETEEVIPLAEEKLEVGKHVVNRGTTRVRRYVVEQPVERDVTLHGERVTVERRRPLGAGESPGAGAFEERTVEVQESEEVPDVHKSARITEEVAVRREATERHETVRDTVRRDEVDVSPANAAAPGQPHGKNR
jgi:uncharacterized protein (TIGR02271 family)